MQMLRLSLLFLLLSPYLVSAEVGFAKSSLWLGKVDVVETESVTLYASLSNTGEEKLSGSVIFYDDGDEFGKVALALERGEGRIVSVSWKPADAGTHTLRAVINSSAGVEVDDITIAVVVAEKPLQTTAPAAAIEGSEDIQKKIAELSPQASETLNPVFEKLDTLRESSAGFLDREIASAKQSLDETKSKKDALAKEKVLGNATEENESENRKLTVSYLFSTLLLYTLSAIRFAVGNAGLFYPLLAGLFLVSLYKLIRRLRNPGGYASDI